MGWMEFAFIITGAVILVISFAIPAGKAGKNVQALKIDEGMIKDLVEREIGNAKGRIDDMAEETYHYSLEKTERAMERMSNEKIMAINEYSDQVLTAINKNHQEVMFLYDMLNDKHTNLVNTVSEASQKAKEIRQTVQDAEITVKEAVGLFAEDPAAEADGGENAGRTEAAGRDGSLPAGMGVEDGLTSESVQEADAAEFIQISAPRVEMMQNVIKEGKTAGAEDGSEPDADEPRGRNNNEKILRLYKLGKSKTAIAKELGVGVGEVKLVIDLFEQ